VSTETFSAKFLRESADLLALLDVEDIEHVVTELAEVRARGGRLFCIGSGGGAAHASHAVCDFRKLAGIEAYAPTDNVAELTARVNDDGWDSSYSAWLRTSRLGPNDLIFVFSVGGGDSARGISQNLVEAIDTAREVGAHVVGVVGRDGGHTARFANACVIVPTIDDARVTPYTESIQSLVAHLLVSHPLISADTPKWESLEP
jgi:D-sedoheptulose 7-phosphate isomerase